MLTSFRISKQNIFKDYFNIACKPLSTVYNENKSENSIFDIFDEGIILKNKTNTNANQVMLHNR